MCRIEEMLKISRLHNTKVVVDTFDKDRGRPKTIMTKLWQLMQSRDTNNLNLDKDLEVILSKMKQMGGSEEVKTRRRWAQDEGEDQ